MPDDVRCCQGPQRDAKMSLFPDTEIILCVSAIMSVNLAVQLPHPPLLSPVRLVIELGGYLAL